VIGWPLPVAFDATGARAAAGSGFARTGQRKYIRGRSIEVLFDIVTEAA
jgi:hypothetical protein